jgi:hypothetical protein
MVAVVILGLVMAWRSRTIQNKPQVLPDGTVLTLVQVDYGKTNVFYGGNWFQKTFRKLIPKNGFRIGKYRLMPPNEVKRNKSQNDNLVFWADGQVGRASFKNIIISNLKVVAFNELGDEYPAYLGEPLWLSPSNFVWDWRLAAFPRDGKTVGLRLLEKSKSNDCRTIAEFVTLNPTPGPHKPLIAEGMPIVKTVGKATFELKELQGDVETLTRAIVQIAENGKLSDAWSPTCFTISEGNGNVVQGVPHLIGETSTGTVWECGMRLDPKHPWKLNIGFGRTKEYSAEEICQLQNVLIQTPGDTGTTVRTNINNTAFEVTGWPHSPASVRVSLPGTLRDERWIKPLKFVGNLGQVVEYHYTLSQYGLFLGVPENELKGSTTFNLTVAVTKPVYVEFIAKPTMITNAASPGFNHKR